MVGDRCDTCDRSRTLTCVHRIPRVDRVRASADRVVRCEVEDDLHGTVEVPGLTGPSMFANELLDPLQAVELPGRAVTEGGPVPVDVALAEFDGDRRRDADATRQQVVGVVEVHQAVGR